MSTYELDDDLVRAFVADSSATDHDKLESPWIEAGNHEEPYRTGAIGRITEVLNPGVDL